PLARLRLQPVFARQKTLCAQTVHMQMGEDVSIIVPVWNGRARLERLLHTLRAQTYPIAEMLIVDNGSDDGAPEAAEQMGARVIRLGSNTGFSHAVNRGINECRTAWLALVNSDVELASDWLERLVEAAQADRKSTRLNSSHLV